jgi:hypothetical protein
MARQTLNIPALKACGKKRHYTVAVAEKHRDQLAPVERRRRPSSPTLKVYHCSQCDAFHVGHSS